MDGLSRGLLETVLVLAGLVLVVLDAFQLVDGLQGGSLLLGMGGFSVVARVTGGTDRDHS